MYEKQGSTNSQHLNIEGNIILNSSVKNTQIIGLTQKCIDNLQYNLPSKFKHPIIGRDDDVQKIYTRLKEHPNHKVVVTGLAGVGKTTIAIHCAHTWFTQEHDSGFPNIAFLHAENRNKVEISLKGLSTKLNIPKELSVGELIKSVAGLYKSKRLLIILDNIERCEDIEEFLDVVDNIYILATSQNTELYEHFHCYTLNELPKDSSLLLIKSILNEIYLDKNDLNILLLNLCELLQGLPLALAHAASWIRDEIKASLRIDPVSERLDLYVDVYAKAIKGYLNKYKEMMSKPFPDQFITVNKRSAFLAIRLNILKVNQSRNSMLKILGYLDPDCIEMEIFKLIFGEDDCKDKLRELTKFSLININFSVMNGEKAQYVSVHRLTQEVIREDNNVNQSEMLLVIIMVTLNRDYFYHHNGFIETYISPEKIKNLFATHPIEEIREIIRHLLRENKIKPEPIDLLEKLGYNISQYLNWPCLHIFLATLVFGRYADICITRADLITKDALNKTTDDGITALHVAAACPIYRGEIIETLIKAGANANAQTTNGMTPLHVASVANESETTRELKHISILETMDLQGETALHKAARHFSFKAIYTLAKRMDVNQVNNDGDTALHLVAAAEMPENIYAVAMTIHGLIIGGASVEAVNNKGETALEVAVRHNNENVTKWLANPKMIRKLL